MAGEIRMMKLDVEGQDVRGCRDPDVTSAASQDMRESSALTEQLDVLCISRQHVRFLLCKVGVITESAA